MPLIVVLVFQVRIIRANNLKEQDVALLNLDNYMKQKVGGKTFFSLCFYFLVLLICNQSRNHQGFMHSWDSIVTFFILLLHVLRQKKHRC